MDSGKTAPADQVLCLELRTPHIHPGQYRRVTSMLFSNALSRLRRVRNTVRAALLVARSRWLMTGVSFASRPVCGGKVTLACTANGRIIIGSGVSFSDNVVIVARGGCIRIGDNSHIGEGCLIVSREQINIGANALIAEYVVIRDQDHALDSDPICRAGFTTAPIEIEDNVWLAAKSTVLKGVHIGSGAVVAAHALVNKPVAARTIVAGVPAKKINTR
ncbi:Putative acetyltransferase [Halioglobus japonicus]|nr:Putative acetyltransferase [Halioglobus japonicus]